LTVRHHFYQEVDIDTKEVDADIKEVDTDTQEVDADMQEVNADTEEVNADTQEVDADMQEVDTDTQEVETGTKEVDADKTELLFNVKTLRLRLLFFKRIKVPTLTGLITMEFHISLFISHISDLPPYYCLSANG